MKIGKIVMHEMENLLRKCIHYTLEELEDSDEDHAELLKKLIESEGGRSRLEANIFKYYLKDFNSYATLDYLSEVSTEGILARAIEMTRFVLFKPDVNFGIKLSDGKIEMINTVIEPFFIKREFKHLIEAKCRAASFPVCVSENAFHYLDRLSKEHLPHDPSYFSSYGVNLFYEVLDYIKKNDEYINIQYEKEAARHAALREICKAIEREVTGVDIAALDYFVKKIKG